MTFNQESASNIDRVEEIAYYLKGLSDRVEDDEIRNALTRAVVKLWPISSIAERIIKHDKQAESLKG